MIGIEEIVLRKAAVIKIVVQIAVLKQNQARTKKKNLLHPSPPGSFFRNRKRRQALFVNDRNFFIGT